MDTQTIDLYGYWDLPRPAHSAGFLSCYCPRHPADASARRPGLLILPGGGYGHVSARESEGVALRFAARGYAAFVLRYAVTPGEYPTALQEAAMAMAYIRRTCREHEVDPSQIAVLGFSAGGHLCGLLGTMFDSPEVMGLGLPGSLRPDALCLCYPVAVSWGRTHEGSFDNLTHGDTALRRKLSLDRLVRRDRPPVFLWHTRDDAAVPCRNSLALAAALEEAGVDFALRIYRHGSHGLSLGDATVFPAGRVPDMSPGVPGWPEEAMEFLKEIGFCIINEEETR